MAAAKIDAVRQLFAAFGSTDTDALSRTIDELVHPQIVLHGDALVPFAYGREAVKQRVLALKAGFPDAAATIRHLFGEGSKAMLHAAIEGTHSAEWLGVPATHRRTAWTMTAIIRFGDDGRMAEAWMIVDALGLLQQLGRIARIPGQGG